MTPAKNLQSTSIRSSARTVLTAVLLLSRGFSYAIALEREMPMRSRYLDSLAEEAACTIGPNPKLTMFHVCWLVALFGVVVVGLADGVVRRSWPGAIVQTAILAVAAWVGGGILCRSAALATAVLLSRLARRGWITFQVEDRVAREFYEALGP